MPFLKHFRFRTHTITYRTCANNGRSRLEATFYVFTCAGKVSQPVKLDLNKKSLPKQKTIQNFTIDAQGFRKTKNENPPTWEMGVTS